MSKLVVNTIEYDTCIYYEKSDIAKLLNFINKDSKINFVYDFDSDLVRIAIITKAEVKDE